jgi:hypothetical protein
MEAREEELLALVKSWMGKIPVRELDILVVDELGKNVSGAGMDTKVINRGIDCSYNPYPYLPAIHRIFVRDISDMSYGNGVGIGMADVISDRLLEKIDWEPTNINSLTASTPAPNRIPMHYPTDGECLEKFWPTVGKFEQDKVTIGWIRNTMELAVLALSENLIGEIRQNSSLEILSDPWELEFDEEGNLVSPLVRAGVTVAH